MQETDILPYNQIVYSQSGIRSGEWDAQASLGFWDINGSPNCGQITKPNDSHKKKRKKKTTYPIVESTQSKITRKRESDEYQELAREQRKHESDDDINWNNPLRIEKGTRRLRIQRTIRPDQ